MEVQYPLHALEADDGAPRHRQGATDIAGPGAAGDEGEAVAAPNTDDGLYFRMTGGEEDQCGGAGSGVSSWL
jgi:hypothetical protein